MKKRDFTILLLMFLAYVLGSIHGQMYVKEEVRKHYAEVVKDDAHMQALPFVGVRQSRKCKPCWLINKRR